MPHINVEAIPWTAFVSPKGAFRGRYREISLALGAKKDAGPVDGGHPFDVSLEVLAPGETCCPYHAHAAQWEFFYILSGAGTVRRDGESFNVKPGTPSCTRPVRRTKSATPERTNCVISSSQTTRRSIRASIPTPAKRT
jgi:mannose-6-phosphate isomerase-like protein (cupin superfamily)